jgi:hypothetical protein
MRIRRLWLVPGLLSIATLAHADDHRAGIFAAMCFTGGDTTAGFHESYEVTLGKNESGGGNGQPAATASRRLFGMKHFSGVADFSLNFGGESDTEDITEVPFLFGVRFTPSWTDHQEFVPFAQVLVGGVYTNNGVEDETSAAFAFGFGVQYFPWRDTSEQGFGAQAQFDYINPGRAGDNIPRFSVGVVYRFKK